jgi:Tol biopolymer transport system component
MKPGKVVVVIVAVVIAGAVSARKNGQAVADPTLLLPQLFGAHLATDSDNRHSALAFSPSGDKLFYSVYVNSQQPQTIFSSEKNNGDWSRPTIASFSGTHKDGQPLVSPDGKRIYFYSKRPRSDGVTTSNDYDIWYVERANEDWSAPINAGQAVNTPQDESLYTISKNADLYFNRRTKEKKNYLMKSRVVDGVLQTPEMLKELSNPESFSKPVNIEGEDYFIFTNNVQKGRFYYSGLFISYKMEDGNWSQPKDMGDMINFGEGRFPSMSPDGKFFFFVSYRSGIAQFYRVDARIIEYLKDDDLDLINQLTIVARDTDIDSMKSTYELLRTKHAEYYRFDETLFNEVASQLVANDKNVKAIEVYEFNFELYPQKLFYPQKLIVALLRESESEYSNVAALIEKESAESQKRLLDEINSAGEVFLQKGRMHEAIRIFELNAKINPGSTWPVYKLGKAYYQMKNRRMAKEYFGQAITLDESNIYARNYLEELDFPHLTGPYLGQIPPGMKPESFASGLLSAENEIEINSVFSPDGNEFYYVIREESSERYDLMFTHIQNGAWTRPGRLKLAGEYSVADVALSPDGTRLYFCSDMPTFWENAKGFDIWYVERQESGWSEPVNVGRNINSIGGETQPSFTTDGSMYFPSWPTDSEKNSVDIYFSRYSNGTFQDAVPLPDTVNSEHNEGNSFVAPDGSYILFARWGMPVSIDGGKGMYISFRQPDGGWTSAKNTLPVFGVYGSLAALSHDGKYLLFSTRQGIYWVDADIVEQLKPGHLK